MDTVHAHPPTADCRLPTASDLMAVAMARALRNGETVFHGVASPLPMVAILLAKRTHAPDLVYVNITGSIDPETVLPGVGSPAAIGRIPVAKATAPPGPVFGNIPGSIRPRPATLPRSATGPQALAGPAGVGPAAGPFEKAGGGALDTAFLGG